MDVMLDRVMCSGIDDEERFVAVVHAAIAAGEAPRLSAFTGEHSV
jgi:hypothetical protein